MTTTIANLEKFHRSKDRIKNLGEVFTPESYVENMLNVLSKNKKNFWDDENTIFFEPSCGHGNIVIPIFKRRLEAFYKKKFKVMGREAAYYAVANAVDTLWAIDIDKKNINECRTRIFKTILHFLKEQLQLTSFELIKKNKEFISHVICALKWQISENEALSGLSCDENCQKAALLTRAGSKWYKKNGHNPIEFENTWSWYFLECKKQKIHSLEYSSAVKMIESLSKGKKILNDNFAFVEDALEEEFRLNHKKDLKIG